MRAMNRFPSLYLVFCSNDHRGFFIDKGLGSNCIVSKYYKSRSALQIGFETHKARLEYVSTLTELPANDLAGIKYAKASTGTRSSVYINDANDIECLYEAVKEHYDYITTYSDGENRFVVCQDPYYEQVSAEKASSLSKDGPLCSFFC